MRKGLLLNAEDSTLIMFPGLTIEKRVAEEGLNILEKYIYTKPTLLVGTYLSESLSQGRLRCLKKEPATIVIMTE